MNLFSKQSLVPNTTIRLLIIIFLSYNPLPSFSWQTAAKFTWKERCPFGQIWLNGRSVKCGELTVQEDREKWDGKKIKIAVLVLESLADQPEPDPVVYLSGGPGAGAIGSIRNWLQHPLLKNRDLILFDQRGTGYSQPKACDQLNESIVTIISQNLSPNEEIEARLKAAAKCQRELAYWNIDESKYNSVENSKDLEALRKALGYKTWNLYGVSYGTRLALQYMRMYPAHVRSTVIDAIAPPNAPVFEELPSNYIRSLQLMFQTCASDPDCQQQFPSLENDFYQLIEELKQNPMLITNPDSVYINAQDLEVLIHQCMYSLQTIPYVPLLISQMKAGNKQATSALVQSILYNVNSFSYWVMYAVNSYDLGDSTSTEGFKQDLANYSQLKGQLAQFKAHTRILEQWRPVIEHPPLYTAVKSNIPTLILSGNIDPITPPHFGELAHNNLANSYHFVFNGIGHGVSLTSNCAKTMLVDFLNQPNTKPDTSCMKTLKPVKYVSNIWKNDGVYEFATSVLRSPKFSDIFLPIVAIFVLFTAFAFYPMYSLIQRLRKVKPNTSTNAKLYKWFGWSVATLGLTYTGLMLGSIASTMVSSPILLAFGLPAWVAYFRFLPWVIGLGGVFILLFSTWLWKVKRWNRPMRIHFIILGISAAYLGALAISYGLF